MSKHRILIISDIHAMSRDLVAAEQYAGSTGGKVFVEERLPTKNQLLGIPNALASITSVDAFLCLGDIAHQAKKIVMLTAWRDICDVKDQLGIGRFFAVTGNHDVASRPEDFENALPSAFVRELNPPFPAADATIKEAYQANGFAIDDREEFGIVLIDTCTLHGYGGTNASEVFNTGHLNRACIDGICAAISDADANFFIIAMHHHPIKVDRIVDTEGDFIESGAELLEAIKTIGKPCFVVHGHKHFVNFHRLGSDLKSPYILSASSLSANAYYDMEPFFSNQFHIVEIEYLRDQNRLRGQILNWDWSVTTWIPSTNTRMPAKIGFGMTDDPLRLRGAFSREPEKARHDRSLVVMAGHRLRRAEM